MKNEPQIWKDCPVPVWQDRDELEWLIGKYRALDPASVLEIGSHEGGTLFHWIREGSPGTKIVSVDQSLLVHKWLWRRKEIADVSNLTLIRGLSQNPRVVERVRAHGPFDFVFIDGGHMFDEVEADWLNYAPLVRPGGIVAFHDIDHQENLRGLQVPLFWQDLKDKGFVTDERVATPGMWGIGVVTISENGLEAIGMAKAAAKKSPAKKAARQKASPPDAAQVIPGPQGEEEWLNHQLGVEAGEAEQIGEEDWLAQYRKLNG